MLGMLLAVTLLWDGWEEEGYIDHVSYFVAGESIFVCASSKISKSKSKASAFD